MAPFWGLKTKSRPFFGGSKLKTPGLDLLAGHADLNFQPLEVLLLHALRVETESTRVPSRKARGPFLRIHEAFIFLFVVFVPLGVIGFVSPFLYVSCCCF